MGYYGLFSDSLYWYMYIIQTYKWKLRSPRENPDSHEEVYFYINLWLRDPIANYM